MENVITTLKNQHLEQNLTDEAEAYLKTVTCFIVASDGAAEIAADEMSRVRAKIKDFEAQRKAITKPLDDTKRAVMDLFRGPLNTLTKAESVIKGKLYAYQQEKEKAARAAAEAERKRIEANAAKRAARAESKGDEAAAEEIRLEAELEAAQAAQAVEQANSGKVAGITARDNWKAEVTDLKTLAQAVADGRLPPHFIQPNMAELNKYAKAVKDTMTVPGVRIYNDKVVAARRSA